MVYTLITVLFPQKLAKYLPLGDALTSFKSLSEISRRPEHKIAVKYER